MNYLHKYLYVFKFYLIKFYSIRSFLKILVCDNYEKHDGTTLKNVYVESHLQLNFHTGSEPETLVIRTIEKQKQKQTDLLVKTIDMNSIRSIM
jgi:hypothetical protein